MTEEVSVRMRPGTLVVLEGLDGTGKSTQRQALENLPWAEPVPLFTHMPSGHAELTQQLYQVLEDNHVTSSLARQLLHLACHAETLPSIRAALRERAVVLDRWWWSTLAYGWFGQLRTAITLERFMSVIELVWLDLEASVTFLFRSPVRPDANNLPAVADGYAWLQSQNAGECVSVPEASPDRTTQFLVNELARRDLLEVRPSV